MKSNIKNKILLLNLLFVIIILFTGCSEQQQLHQKLIIQGISIDKINNNLNNNYENYKVTVQALDFQNPMSEDEPSLKTIEIQGKSVTEALDNMSKTTSLKPVYSQNLVLILGEEAAKSGVNNFIDFFIRHCETRPKVKICVSKNQASEIFKFKNNNKNIKSKNIHDLIPQKLNSDVLHFVSNLKNLHTDPWVAWLDIQEKNNDTKELILKGVGVFKDDKLIDFLENQDAFGFMIIKNTPNFNSCVINTEQTGEVTCVINNSQPKITVNFNNNKIKYNIKLNINSSVFSLDKNNNIYTHNFDETKQILEKELSNKIQNICNNIITKTLKLNIDVFEFSKILRNSYPKYFKKIRNNWRDYLKNIEFEINQNIKITATGKEPI